MVFDRRAEKREGHWVWSPLPTPLIITCAEIFKGVFVAEVDQSYNAQLEFHGVVTEVIETGHLLLASDAGYSGSWRRGERFWNRS